jgi:DNA-binding response OmpR family regulator
MHRHILVVDDDGDVRDVIVEMLTESGFVTTAAPGGVVMRDLIAAQGTPFDAVVLDCLMPGEASAELALHAKQMELPVVMVSGSHEMMAFAEDNGLQLLRKPFRMAELIEAVEAALASGQFGQRGA